MIVQAWHAFALGRGILRIADSLGLLTNLASQSVARSGLMVLCFFSLCFIWVVHVILVAIDSCLALALLGARLRRVVMRLRFNDAWSWVVLVHLSLCFGLSLCRYMPICAESFFAC